MLGEAFDLRHALNAAAATADRAIADAEPIAAGLVPPRRR